MCSDAYGRGRKNMNVRYVVHETVVVCSSCGVNCSASSVRRAGRAYRCSQCGEKRVNLNLRDLERTRVREIVTDEGVVDEESVLSEAYTRSQASFWSPQGSYSYPFEENKRILAHAGLETKQLFTPRNFSLLAFAADRIAAEPDDQNPGRIGADAVRDRSSMLSSDCVQRGA